MNNPFAQFVHAHATPAPAAKPTTALSHKPRPFVPGFPSMFTPPPAHATPSPTPAPMPLAHGNFPPPAPRKPLTLRGPTPPGLARHLGSSGNNPSHVGNFPKPGKQPPLPQKLSLIPHLATLRHPPAAHG